MISASETCVKSYFHFQFIENTKKHDGEDMINSVNYFLSLFGKKHRRNVVNLVFILFRLVVLLFILFTILLDILN